MNEQEMQFADPDWKPGGQIQQENTLVSSAGPGRTVNKPLPTSFSGLDQKSSDTFSYEQGYRSQQRYEYAPSYAIPQQTQLHSTGGTTRGHSYWWIWVIIAILFISFISGGISSNKSYPPPFGNSSRSFPHQVIPPEASYSYVLPADLTQIQINDPYGTIHLQSDDPNSQSIAVNTDNLDPGAVQFIENKGVLTIALNMPTNPEQSNITITLPSTGAVLNLTTSTNDIEVDGYTGQLTAQSDSGSITLIKDALSGQSTITTNGGNIEVVGGQINGPTTTISSQGGYVSLKGEQLSGRVTVSTGNGAINFAGSLGPQGNYHFSTTGGSMTLMLPGNTAMDIQHTTGPNGSYQSDFQDSTGSSHRAPVNLQTDNGSINVYNQGS